MCDYIRQDMCLGEQIYVTDSTPLETLALDSICIMELLVFAERLTGGKLNSDILQDLRGLTVSQILTQLEFNENNTNNAS
jgi:acyl carrier protein